MWGQHAHEAVDQRQHDRDEESHRRIGDCQEIEGEKDAKRAQWQHQIDAAADQRANDDADHDAEERTR